MKRKFAQKGIVYKQSYENEATGNPVILENICPNCVPNVSISFSPIQAGEGNPSPENIRPISGWDSVWVTRWGKNLIRITANEPQTKNGVTWTVSDGIIHAQGTASPTSRYVAATNIFLPKGTYAVNPAENIYYELVTSNTVVVQTKTSFTLESDFIGNLQFYVLNGTTANTDIYPQIELGSTSTAYEPYQGDTYDITLPETIYGGTVDVGTGEGSKEWFTVILTGNERWMAWESRPNSFFTDIEGHKNLANDATNVFCSNFSFGWGDDRYTPYHFFSQNPGALPDNVRLCFTFDETVTNIDLAKQWIAAQYAAGTPVTVCYKLVTPEPFQATSNQPIPALDGVNTLYTNGDEVKFNCTILANPQPCNY